MTAPAPLDAAQASRLRGAPLQHNAPAAATEWVKPP